MTARPRALLIGYHGMRNLGDDIFLRVTCAWLVATYGVGQIRVTARRGRIPETLSGARLEAFEPDHYPVTSRLRWVLIAKEMMRADVIVFAAGSIFTILPFVMFWCTLSFVRLLRGPDLPILALGVSVGPFRNWLDGVACRRAFRSIDKVLLRDQASATLMEAESFECENFVSYDLALAWGPAWELAESGPSRIGVALNDYHSLFSAGGRAVDTERCAVVAKALAAAAAERSEVEVVVFSVCADQAYGDAAASERLVSLLPSFGGRIRVVTYDGLHPEILLNELRTCRAVVATRMHAGMLAMMAGIPVFQISYAQKIFDFFRQCNLGKKNIVDATGVNAAEIEEFLRDALTGKLEGLAFSRRSSLQQCSRQLQNDLREFPVSL